MNLWIEFVINNWWNAGDEVIKNYRLNVIIILFIKIEFVINIYLIVETNVISLTNTFRPYQ